MKSISSLAIAFTYVGTLVGAGFASGQEIKSYFTDYGVYGIAGYCFASFLIFFLGKKIMLMCKKNNVDSYDKLISLLSNNVLGKMFDFFITVFLILILLSSIFEMLSSSLKNIHRVSGAIEE